MTEKHVDSWELLINLELAFFFLLLAFGAHCYARE